MSGLSNHDKVPNLVMVYPHNPTNVLNLVKFRPCLLDLTCLQPAPWHVILNEVKDDMPKGAS